MRSALLSLLLSISAFASDVGIIETKIMNWPVDTKKFEVSIEKDINNHKVSNKKFVVYAHKHDKMGFTMYRVDKLIDNKGKTCNFDAHAVSIDKEEGKIWFLPTDLNDGLSCI